MHSELGAGRWLGQSAGRGLGGPLECLEKEAPARGGRGAGLGEAESKGIYIYIYFDLVEDLNADNVAALFGFEPSGSLG